MCTSRSRRPGPLALNIFFKILQFAGILRENPILSTFWARNKTQLGPLPPWPKSWIRTSCAQPWATGWTVHFPSQRKTALNFWLSCVSATFVFPSVCVDPPPLPSRWLVLSGVSSASGLESQLGTAKWHVHAECAMRFAMSAWCSKTNINNGCWAECTHTVQQQQKQFFFSFFALHAAYVPCMWAGCWGSGGTRPYVHDL